MKCKWCGAQVFPYCACECGGHCGKSCHDAHLRKRLTETPEDGDPDLDLFLEEAMSKGPPWVCPVCGRESKSKAGLATHFRSHKNVFVLD